MKRSGNKNLKIIAACSVAIFSLLVLVGGAFSWFTIMMSQSLSGTNFAVINTGTCDLYDIKLYKFDYMSHSYGGDYIIDYTAPENGRVNQYSFNKELNQFGYMDGSNWHQVSVMNVFDPVELEIRQTTVRELNCDSIYKFTISTTSFTDASLSASVSKILDTVKETEDIFLSSCVNYDLYLASDLLDSNPLFSTEDDPLTPEDESSTKNYYPSYIDKSETLTEYEDVFYKLSYLSSLKDTHAHLYGGVDNEVVIGAEDVSFTYDALLEQSFLDIYINVNYAPSQLEDTISLIYVQTIKAICDFGFKFYFTEDNN